MRTESTVAFESTVALTRTEHAVLALLAQGLTDESVARRLSISVRTVRRTVAEMMIRLDAVSRSQAGIKAVRCGWL